MWEEAGRTVHCSPHSKLPPAPHRVLAALPRHISISLPAPPPAMAPAQGQQSWGCARSLRHVGLALLQPAQSLEGAPGLGAVWSCPCMLGWAGHPSPGQATAASPGDAWAARPAWSMEHSPAGTICNGCPVPQGWDQPRAGCQRSAPCILPMPGRRDRDISKRHELKLVHRLVCLIALLGDNIPSCQTHVLTPHPCALLDSLGPPHAPEEGWGSPILLRAT